MRTAQTHINNAGRAIRRLDDFLSELDGESPLRLAALAARHEDDLVTFIAKWRKARR